MRKLLVIPNDPSSSYINSIKKDFISEFNPPKDEKKFFNEVIFLNWRDSEDFFYNGIYSKAILKNKEDAEKKYKELSNFEIPFDSPEASFTEIFEKDKNKKSYIKRFNPNIIRAFNTHFATDLGTIAKESTDAPLIISAHDPTRLTEGIKNADYLICESKELKNICVEKFNMDPRKIEIIPKGINLEHFYPRSKNKILEYMPEHFLEPPYKILSSSRIVKGQNIETILKSISIAKEKLPGLMHIHLGSEGSPKERIYEIKKLSEELGLSETSYFLGKQKQDELAFYYSWADAFVLPVLWDGLNMPSRNALACGTPVISTNYGSSTEIIKHGYNGITVNPMDPEEISEAIVLLLKNKSLNEKLSENARNSVKKYDLNVSMKQQIKLYERILEKK